MNAPPGASAIQPVLCPRHERAFPLRLVKACTKRFRGNAMDTAAEANAIQAGALSDETWQEMSIE